MWLIWGSLGAIGAVGWLKIGRPLYRLLLIHDDVSRGGTGVETDGFGFSPRMITPAELERGTEDLESLARSLRGAGAVPVVPAAVPEPQIVDEAVIIEAEKR